VNLSTHDPIVICGGGRTPIGQSAKSLSGIGAAELMSQAVRAALANAAIKAESIESVILGWVGQDVTAPNIARVVTLKSGLREEIPGFTVQCNCVSSVEALASAARVILTGEAEVVMAGGVESMSTFPYTIQGPRSHKALRSTETLKANWPTLWQEEGVSVGDTVEQGLTDPVKHINMAGTAEVCAQLYGVPREEQDRYAHESFKRCLAAWNRGFYSSHVVPAKGPGGQALLEKDEYPYLRASLAEKPAMIGRAPVLLESPAFTMKDFYLQFGQFMPGKAYGNGATQATVTLFNACPRSDGAAAAVVTRLSRAKKEGWRVEAVIRSWGFHGNNPAHMGVGPAFAADLALKRAGIKFQDLGQIELHEPFAATVLSIFKLGQKNYGHDWQEKWESGAVNPNGGTIALGHPLGATGARLLLNLLGAFRENKSSRYGLIAGCSGGGVGAAMIFERAGA